MARALAEHTVQDLRAAINEALSKIDVVPGNARVALAELMDVLDRHGEAVIFPAEATVSTQQAAAPLGVSRNDRRAAHRPRELTADVAGVHRRISVSELDRYRRESASARRDALQRLVDGIDYDTAPDEPLTTR